MNKKFKQIFFSTLFFIGIFYFFNNISAFNILTAYPTGNTFYVTETGDPRDLIFADSGSKMYINNFNGNVYQYTLSTPYDLTTAVYDNKTFDLDGSDLQAMTMSEDGTVLFALRFYTPYICQYNLSTPFDITTAVAGDTFYISGYQNDYHFTMKPDGSKLYVLSDYEDYIVQYALSTPWDLTTIAYESRIRTPVSYGTDGQRLSIDISDDGQHIFIETTNNELIHHVILSTPWDVTSATYTPGNYFNASSYDGSVRGIKISPDGDTLWLLGNQHRTIYEFSLNKPIVDSFTPTDNATDVAVDSNLIMDFNEEISTSTGSIILYDASDDSVVEAFDVDSDRISKSDDVITINPTADLNDDSSFYVLVSSTMFVSSSGKYYAGINTSTTWNFSTIDLNAPTVQTSDLVFSNVNYSSTTLSWTNGNGDGRVIFAKQANSGTATPVNATIYSADANFGDGDQIGESGWYAIYNSTSDATSVNVTGLTPSTDYIFQIFEYDLSGSDPLYFIDTASNNPNTQTTSALVAPDSQASEVTFSSVIYNSVVIGWTRGNGEKVTVFVKQADSGTTTPVDTTNYSASSVFGSGDQVGETGWYVVYDGAGTSVTVTGLSAGTNYIVQVFEYNGLGTGQPTYFTDTASNNPNITTTDAVETIYANSSTGNDSTGEGSIGSPYKTFYKAYTMAEAGDTLDLTGTFDWSSASETGDASQSGYTIGKDIIIQGHGPDNTIIQAASSANTAGKRVFTVTAGKNLTVLDSMIRYGYPTSYNSGGCIYVPSTATLTLTRSEVNNCKAQTGYGGGIYAAGNTTITNSSIYSNSCYYDGAGIVVGSGAVLTLTNSTVYSNTAPSYPSYNGGGILIGASDSDTGTAIITNSTITGNYSPYGGGGIYLSGNAGLYLYLKNSIVAGNSSNNGGSYNNIYKETAATITSNGYNIIGASSGFSTATTGDWTDTNNDGVYNLYSVGTTGSLNLDIQASYNDNPYKTYTYGILADSIAINNATTTAHSSVSIPSLDQRGAGRVGTLDIGAFEYEGTGLSVVEPTTQASNISFSLVDNKQMTFSWANGNGNKRAVFAKQAGSGTASPVDTESYSASSVFGSGDQIDETGWYCIYNGYGTSLTMTGLTENTSYAIQIFEYTGVTSGTTDYFISTSTNNPVYQATHNPITIYANYSTGNDSTGDGSAENPYKTFYKAYTMSTGGDTLDLTGTFDWSNSDETGDASTSGYTIGKDIIIQGHGPDTTIIQAASSANTAGKRVFTITDGYDFTINDSSVRYGYGSGSGGCVLVPSTATFILTRSELNNCRSTGSYGGGIYASGNTTITNSSIYSNRCYYDGAGIVITGGANLIMTNSTVYNNTAPAYPSYNGGGILIGANDSSTATAIITNSTITGNYSPYGGGGIYLSGNAGLYLYLKNSIVDGNSANNGTNYNDIYKESVATIISNGYNVVGDYTGFTPTTGDWTDTNNDGVHNLYSVGTTGSLNLDSVASLNSSLYNTLTYALLESSIAINNGNSSANNGVSVPSTDQRGAGRYNTVDIGAFEYEGTGLEDLTAPTVSTLSPANEATGISKTANLVITFDETVVTSSEKNITIKALADGAIVETISTDGDQISIDGAEVTINPDSTLEDLTGYYVEIDEGAFVDTSGNPFGGISGTSTWSFTIGDFTNPQIFTLSPANEATGVALDVNLVITFTENVTAVADKNIFIKTLSGDSTVETITANGGLVSISGSQVTINPSSDLNDGTSYYILIDSGAFVDEDSNPYAGISSNDTWRFTTLLETVYANSTSGNDTTGNGTSGSPYKTFYKAYTMCTVCDTLDLTGIFTWTNTAEAGDSATTGYTLAKNLVLQGHGPDATIIQSASYDNYADRRVFTISSGMTITINNLAIRYGKVSGSGNDGGGIKNSGILTLNNCEVYNNRTLGDGGGGISNRHTLTVASSTIYNNIAYYMGGGLLNHYYVDDAGYMTVTNSTIAYNQQLTTTAYTEGGGIHFRQGNGTITNSTIAYNTAYGVAGVGIDDADGTIAIKNTIIAKNNRRGYSWGIDFGYRQSGYGNVADNGNNIIGYSQNYSFTTNTDWIGASTWGTLLNWDRETFTKYGTATTGTISLDSALGINSNASKTQTLRLLTGSIAINNGTTGTNGSVSVPSTDQRGTARSGNTDIGSFEFTGSSADTTAPTIEDVLATAGDTSATITWSTSEESTAQVKYDANTSKSTFTPIYNSDELTLGHEIEITGLVACTKYYYKVISKDAAENWTESDEKYFYTAGCAGNASVEEVTETSANPEENASLSQTSGGLTIDITIPTTLAENHTDFQMKSLSSSAVLGVLSKPTNYSEIGSSVFDIKALTDPASTVSSFDDAVTVTVSYSDDEISGLDESSLWVHRHDGSDWNALDGCTVDTNANTVTCETSNFSVFGLFGQATVASEDSNSGGGAFVPPSTPKVNVVPIISDDKIIFDVDNATQMAISESTDFSGSSWEPYSESYKTTAKILYIKFRSKDGGVSKVFTVEGVKINQYEGKLIKYINSPKVYLIENGLKKWIKNEETFNYYKFDWEKILTISDDINFVNGDNLTKTTVSIPNLSTTYNFTRNLERGANGEDVRELQRFLNNNGYLIDTTGIGSPGNESIYFGNLTQQALIKFQRDHNLPAYGYFGPLTRGIINN